MSECSTSLMGRIFGHKWWFSVGIFGSRYTTNYCIRCGYMP